LIISGWAYTLKWREFFIYTVLDAMDNPKVYDFQDRLIVSNIAKYLKYLLPKLAKENTLVVAYIHHLKEVVLRYNLIMFLVK